jgi:thiol:disulfide interchange protein DsbD
VPPGRRCSRCLGLALLGGLVLNLMPCVFPILAMKAVALARLGGAAQGAVRREAAGYTAGVVLGFWAGRGAADGARGRDGRRAGASSSPIRASWQRWLG